MQKSFVVGFKIISGSSLDDVWTCMTENIFKPLFLNGNCADQIS